MSSFEYFIQVHKVYLNFGINYSCFRASHAKSPLEIQLWSKRGAVPQVFYINTGNEIVTLAACNKKVMFLF